MDPNANLCELRSIANIVIQGGRISPDQQYRAADLITALDAWICNGGFLPRDWDSRGIPSQLVIETQKWEDLRNERTRVAEAEGELDYATIRQFEEEQEDAATEIADLCASWLSGLGKLQ